MAAQRLSLFVLLAILARPLTSQAAPGTEGASFLDIPVGGGPAAMGAAYTALAEDAYAPVWNPAGLGFLKGPEMSGTHQPYLETVHYEYFGYAHPVGPSGFGLALQYLGTGELDRRDDTGTPLGTFTSNYTAYSLAYGRRINDRWAIGVTAKGITAKIADASAQAFAGDLGLLFKPTARLTIGAVATQLGNSLKFVQESDPLPMTLRLAGAYQLSPEWRIASEGIYHRNDLLSGALGGEYRYGEYLAIRGGYNTAHTKELSTITGFTAGFGLYLFGQELDYAWVPFGDLGTSYYLSLVVRFGKWAKSEAAVMKKRADREPPFEKLDLQHDSDYQNLYDLLSEDERKSIKNSPAKPAREGPR